MNKKYILSNFVKKIFLKKDKYAVFNNLLLKPILMNKKEVDILFRNKNNLNKIFTNNELKLLIDSGIAIGNTNIDKEAKNLLKDNSKMLFNNNISLLYIIPVGCCNLKCKYCFIGQINNNKTEVMDYNTINNAINKFYNHLKSNNQEGVILFYGGEPTLDLNILNYAVNLVNSFNDKNIQLSIITNATLINEDMINLFKKNNILIGISIDGPKDLTDKYRIFKNKDESVYETVISKIKLLKENNINFGLSVTISDDSLKNKEFLQWLASLNVKNINFNLMHYTKKNDEWLKYYKNVSKFLFKAYDYLNKYNIKEDRLLRKMQSFFNRDFKYNDCGAIGGQQLTIKPNGDITICHACWNSCNDICGNINQNSFEDVFNTEIYKKWKNNLTINKSKCLKCPAISICGGGCPIQSKILFDNEKGIDKAFCIHTKFTLKELLKRHFELDK